MNTSRDAYYKFHLHFIHNKKCPSILPSSLLNTFSNHVSHSAETQVKRGAGGTCDKNLLYEYQVSKKKKKYKPEQNGET
jgi:hypothetical protein